RLRVMNREGVLNGARVGSQKRVDEFGVLAMRMAVGIEPGVAIKAGGLDNERISVPVRCGNTVPARRKVLGPLEIRIHRDPMEPGILLPQEGQRIVAMNNLDSVR